MTYDPCNHDGTPQTVLVIRRPRDHVVSRRADLRQTEPSLITSSAKNEGAASNYHVCRGHEDSKRAACIYASIEPR